MYKACDKLDGLPHIGDMKRIRLIFLILLCWPGGIFAHSVHMSFGRFVVQDSTVSGKVVVFADDYADGFTRFHEGKVAPTNEERVAWTQAFLEKHICMFVNDQPVKPTFVRMGLENSTIWIELVFKTSEKITTFEFENRLLFELFPDQQNITTFMVGEQAAHLVFTKDHARQAVFK